MELAAIRGWAREHPQIADVALGIALFVLPSLVVLVGRHRDALHNPELGDLVAVGTALVVVAGRRRWPAALLALNALTTGVVVAVTHAHHPLLTGAGVLVAFTLAARTDRRRAWQIGGGCAAGLFVVGGLFASGGWWAPENLGTLAWSAAAVALGDASRSHRAYIAEVEERARRAEETREEEARRRVAEERLRIARELHDVVAHHIAVITVQAGAATHVLHNRPEAVGAALTHIRRAADTVLKELATVVGLLRGSDEFDTATEPTRGLTRLSELLDTFAATGLRVEHRQHGTARDLPTMVDLAAYRIVQEALTNAQKHGTGRALLAVTYTPEAIQIDVTNAVVAKPPGTGSGYGLIGMRERAAAAGGHVATSIQGDDRFAVHAELPASTDVPP